MPVYKVPKFRIENFSKEDNRELRQQLGQLVKFYGARNEGSLSADYKAPTIRMSGLSDDENAELNNEIEATLKDAIDSEGPQALGPVAAAVIGSVVGSVASTIVSKKLDARTSDILVDTDFDLDILDRGGI